MPGCHPPCLPLSHDEHPAMNWPLRMFYQEPWGSKRRQCQRARADQRCQASGEPRAGQRRALEQKNEGYERPRDGGGSRDPCPRWKSCGELRGTDRRLSVREGPSPRETGYRKIEE